MSNPNIPNITPQISITRDDAINLLLISMAMEELSLSHLVNAEAEKIQYVLGTLPGLEAPATISDVLQTNASVRSVLAATIQKELIIEDKLEQVLNAAASPPTGGRGLLAQQGQPAYRLPELLEALELLEVRGQQARLVQQGHWARQGQLG